MAEAMILPAIDDMVSPVLHGLHDRSSAIPANSSLGGRKPPKVRCTDNICELAPLTSTDSNTHVNNEITRFVTSRPAQAFDNK